MGQRRTLLILRLIGAFTTPTEVKVHNMEKALHINRDITYGHETWHPNGMWVRDGPYWFWGQSVHLPPLQRSTIGQLCLSTEGSSSYYVWCICLFPPSPAPLFITSSFFSFLVISTSHMHIFLFYWVWWITPYLHSFLLLPLFLTLLFFFSFSASPPPSQKLRILL